MISRRHRLSVPAICVALSIALLGCSATESPFEEAQKHSREAAQKLHEATKQAIEDSERYNRILNREYREDPVGSLERTCTHLRTHQLHSPDRILAQEAREFIETECE